MLGQPKVDLAQKYGIKAIGQNSRVTTDKLKRLATLVDQGVIKPHIDKIFSLEKASEAFEYFENNHPRGKVVVKIKD